MKPTRFFALSSEKGKKTKTIAAGKSTTLVVVLPKGKFAYLCTLPGHAPAGMKGVLRVK